MDAKNHDGRANIKPIKIEKGVDKYSRENVLNSTWMPAKWIIWEQKTLSSQENISDINKTYLAVVYIVAYFSCS